MLYELNSLCEESRLARLKGKSVSRGVKFTHNPAISVHSTFYSFIGKFTHYFQCYKKIYRSDSDWLVRKIMISIWMCGRGRVTWCPWDEHTQWSRRRLLGCKLLSSHARHPPCCNVWFGFNNELVMCAWKSLPWPNHWRPLGLKFKEFHSIIQAFLWLIEMFRVRIEEVYFELDWWNSFKPQLVPPS